jgi:HSP20 family protein
MALYFTNPYSRMMAHRRMFNRMWNEDWTGDNARLVVPGNVKDNNEGYEITVELPGVRADELSIQVVNDTVTIQGEIKPSAEEQVNYLLRERSLGRFARTLRLPETVDSTRVEASLKDGILTLSVPKAEEARPKTIKVNVK